jgi:hypothetical protein
LSYALGSQKQGSPFVFNYTDAVKLAGHSCPAVSGAFKLTQKALKALYGEETPVRGGVRVLIKGGPEHNAYNRGCGRGRVQGPGGPVCEK